MVSSVSNCSNWAAITAGRLLTVVALPRPQREQIAVCLQHGSGSVAEPERRRQKDVGVRTALHEVAREIEAACTSSPVQHPFRRRRTMVHVTSVDVRARVEQQIDDRG